MDYPGLRTKLIEYVELIDKIGTYKWGAGAEYKEVQGALHRAEPGVRKILNTLESKLGDFSTSFPKGWTQARECSMKGIGICEESQEIEVMLAPDVPNLRVDRLHARVWAAAQPFWNTGHRSVAVREACEALNTVIQDKIQRRDSSNTNLIKDCFSDNKPTEKSPRLRFWEYDQSDTWRSIHEGMRFLGMGCFMAVRNINSHGAYEELSEQEALEAIAVASLLARKVEIAYALRHEDDPLHETEEQEQQTLDPNEVSDETMDDSSSPRS